MNLTKQILLERGLKYDQPCHFGRSYLILRLNLIVNYSSLLRSHYEEFHILEKGTADQNQDLVLKTFIFTTGLVERVAAQTTAAQLPPHRVVT